MQRNHARATSGGLLMLALVANSGFQRGDTSEDTIDVTDAYRVSIEEWQNDREARMRSASGWLTVCGLYWIEPGANDFGHSDLLPVRLPDPTLPDAIGSFTLSGSAGKETITLRCHSAGALTILNPSTTDLPTMRSSGDEAQGGGDDEASVSVTPGRDILVQSDRDGSATRFQAGRVTFWVLERGGRYGIRVRDPESELRKQFTGIDNFPIDPEFRIQGTFRRFDPPEKLIVPSILGYADTSFCYGSVDFVLRGREQSLRAMSDSAEDRDLFFVFRDQTTGDETYGGGRFLVASVDDDGAVALDFNKAYNPPCAFNPYTTCPLPPRENDLSVRVEAGERNYADLIEHGTDDAGEQ